MIRADPRRRPRPRLLAGGAGAASKVKVVASLPDLKALTEAVGGDLVEVDSLARGTQNPHDIEVRPSLMLKLRRADLLVRNGVGGDPWVEPLLMGAQNAQIFPGAPGLRRRVGRGAHPRPIGPVDRSRGDVHPEGNPHYTMDPANVRPGHPEHRGRPQAGGARECGGLRRAAAGVPDPPRGRPGPLAEDDGARSRGAGRHLPRDLQLFSEPLRSRSSPAPSRIGPVSRPRPRTSPTSSG